MAFACKQIVSLQAYTGSAPTCNSKRCTTICKAPSLQSQRPFLGRQCSTSSRIEASVRRNIAAPVQSIATVDNYVADVPVAGEKAKWYTLVANAEFMLHDVQNEAFAEQLRERRRLYGEKDMKQDFFLVSEPTWLDKQFPEDAKKVKRPCVALVSTDKIWITFMKLRLDRVMKLELGEMTPEEALDSGAPPPEFPPLDRTKWTAPYSPYKPGWWKAFEPASFFDQQH